MRSSREFMMRVLVEMLVKITQKIRCGIRAEEGDSSAGLFYNKIEIIYNKIVRLYS